MENMIFEFIKGRNIENEIKLLNTIFDLFGIKVKSIQFYDDLNTRNHMSKWPKNVQPQTNWETGEVIHHNANIAKYIFQNFPVKEILFKDEDWLTFDQYKNSIK